MWAAAAPAQLSGGLSGKVNTGVPAPLRIFVSSPLSPGAACGAAGDCLLPAAP